ncbi:HAD-IA family hydrolase [Streptomyces axinellae]|uniref:HAD family hydrolase n=1 Tax=Streptomyces axinellae TaxID=552788 RepID=UPI0031CE4479
MFDTDGVLVDSARLHAAAWKVAFDALLEAAPPSSSESRRPFGTEEYRRYVDGRPRIEGAGAFLASRGIRLPLGDEKDAPGIDSVWAVAARKEQDFTARLRTGEVRVWPGTVRLLSVLRAARVPCAAVSASRHARELLTRTGLLVPPLVVLVDGQEAVRLGLAGKPEPDLFREAAARLETAVLDTAVVEDALAGVEAGRRGGFGLVVGVNRSGDPDGADDLLEYGADLVVDDLGDLVEQGRDA